MKLPNASILAALSVPKEVMKPVADIQAEQAKWIQLTTSIHGKTESAERIRFAANTIIVRSRKLSTESSLDFAEVAKFLFGVTRQWMIHKQKPLRNCINDLPEDLKALGIMKMVEDSDEVRSIMGRPN